MTSQHCAPSTPKPSFPSFGGAFPDAHRGEVHVCRTAQVNGLPGQVRVPSLTPPTACQPKLTGRHLRYALPVRANRPATTRSGQQHRPGTVDDQYMSISVPTAVPFRAETALVTAMLANHIPLTLLPDLAWPATVAAADFTPVGAPC